MMTKTLRRRALGTLRTMRRSYQNLSVYVCGKITRVLGGVCLTDQPPDRSRGMLRGSYARSFIKIYG